MSKIFLNQRQLCERYSVVSRTVDRWVQAGVLPPPLRMRTRKIYDLDLIEASERQRMAQTPQNHSKDFPESRRYRRRKAPASAA